MKKLTRVNYTRIGDTIPVMYLPHKLEITDSYDAVVRFGGIKILL